MSVGIRVKVLVMVTVTIRVTVCWLVAPDSLTAHLLPGGMLETGGWSERLGSGGLESVFWGFGLGLHM